MNFKSAGAIENNVYCLLLADQPRAENRALINRLFNGGSPYTEQEIEANHGATNVNDLSSTIMDFSARGQFDNAFVVPDPLFDLTLDFGPSYKRLEWAAIIQKEINKCLKDSAYYAELQQSVFANVVLHGPGWSMWDDEDCWLADPLGVEDVLVPGGTLRSMRNLEQFAVYRQYTGAKLYRMTHGPNVDKAWNMPLVDKCLAWVNKQAELLNGQQWPDVWFPEKMEERWKSDNGIYAGDVAPTVNCWDFYFWNDNGKKSGWNRRIILDAWGQPGFGGAPLTAPTRKFEHGKGEFLFDPGDRIYADKLDHIMHWQSGDASAVAPFRYHSQRSLGYLLYAVCHLQNRLYCKFTDSVFESLLQYFRVANPADMDRLTKIDLIDKGLLPEGLNFVKPEERWKVDRGLVNDAFQMNRIKMNDMSASFSQDFDIKGQEHETATRTMAKVNSTQALVAAILNRAALRERYRYMEICRRFCKPNSSDLDVKRVRLKILKQGVPVEALNVDMWNIQTTKTIGNGNKIMASAIADKLMAIRPQLEPEAQKKVDRIYISTNTDNWALANNLVPEAPQISNSIHDSELAFGSLMQGIKVNPREGLNALEVAETIIRLMEDEVLKIEQTDNVGTPEKVKGLTMAAAYANAFIQQLAQNKFEKGRVKMLNEMLSEIGNKVKGFAQRQAEMMQQQAQNGNGGLDPEIQAKIQAILLQAQTKSKIQEQNAAQRTAQKQLQFEQKIRQDEQKHLMATRQDLREHGATLAKTGAETAQSLAINRVQAATEPPEESS